MPKNNNHEKNIKDSAPGEVSLRHDEKLELPMRPEMAPENEALSKEALENSRIRHELENMDLPDSVKLQAQSQADQIKSLEEQEKIKNLLQAAKAKGVPFAVNVAKNMDPYILDVFHDRLVKEGYYKKFVK